MNLNRRSFLLGSIALAASMAVPEVIPFNRKWFFPLSPKLKNLWLPEDDFSERFIKPAITGLINEMDNSSN